MRARVRWPLAWFQATQKPLLESDILVGLKIGGIDLAAPLQTRDDQTIVIEGPGAERVEPVETRVVNGGLRRRAAGGS